MTMMTESVCYPSTKDVCMFIAEYSFWLFSSGSTVIRLEKNVRRIAEAFGMKVDFSILPHHIHITVRDSGSLNSYTTVSEIKSGGISFNINTMLSRLSWDISDRKIGFDEAKERLGCIVRSTGSLDPWLLIALVSFANASFCRLFGGDIVAMGVVFISTAAGYLMKQILMERKVDFRLVVIICSFISSILASADGLFSLGCTPELALGTSVLYLVPGIPFINSFCDMLDKHYICAFGRMTDAVVVTACLSLGLLCSMMIMHKGMF